MNKLFWLVITISIVGLIPSISFAKQVPIFHPGPNVCKAAVNVMALWNKGFNTDPAINPKHLTAKQVAAKYVDPTFKGFDVNHKIFTYKTLINRFNAIRKTYKSAIFIYPTIVCSTEKRVLTEEHYMFGTRKNGTHLILHVVNYIAYNKNNKITRVRGSEQLVYGNQKQATHDAYTTKGK